MQVQVEETGALTRMVTVTLPKDAYEGRVLDGLRKLQKRHRQRGFRPGKVPMSVIKAQFGPAVEADVVEELVRDSLPKALKDHPELVYVAPPEVVGRGQQGFGLQYRFEAERLPELAPANYEGMAAEKAVVKASDEEIDAKLEEIRLEHAVREPVEDRQQVQDGDLVDIKYTVLRDEEEGHSEEIELEVGSGKMLPELEAGVIGQSVGEEKILSLENERLGQMQLKVVVNGIFQRVLPALDDELAVDDGRAEDLEGLKAKIREEIEAGYEERSEVEVRRALTDQLVEFNPFELPAGFLDMQLREEARRRLQPLVQQGLDPKMFSPDMLMDGLREDFTQMMRRSFLLDAIADKESLEISDEEVEAHIQEKVAPQQQRQFKDPRAREGLRQELRMEKAYQHIRSLAKLEEVQRDASWFDRDQQPADAVEGEEAEVTEAVEAQAQADE